MTESEMTAVETVDTTNDNDNTTTISTQQTTDDIDLTRKPDRPPSAYMFYADAHRPSMIQQQRSAGEKVDVGAIMKELGRQWKELTDEQRQTYDALHNTAKQRYDTIVAQRKLLGLDNDDTVNEAIELILPPHKVKKVMMLDNEIKNISKEALMLVTKLTELFVSQLATRIDTVCQTAGRKTARNIDYAVVLRRDIQYQWLNLSLQTYPAQTTTNDDNKHDDESDHSDTDNAPDTDQAEHHDEQKEPDNTHNTDTIEPTNNENTDTTNNEQKDNTSPKQRKPNKKLPHVSDLTTLLKSTEQFVSIQPKNKTHSKPKSEKRKKSISNADGAEQTPATKKSKSKLDTPADKCVQSISNFFPPGSTDAVIVDEDD